MVCAMAFALVCLAAMPAASAAPGDDGGILYIPSAASIAHCPTSCGEIKISYPFGIGAGCFRRGFALTCNHSTQPPKLFLGNSTTQITGIYDTRFSVPAIMFFNSTLEESRKMTYKISWDAPVKSVTILSSNSFLFLGCDFDVDLFDSLRKPIGTCMIRCHGVVLPNQGPCNGFGCCSITLLNDISGFQGTIARVGNITAESYPLHPGIMGFISELRDSYMQINATGIFSSWTNLSKIDDDILAILEVAIMDQPSCEKAKMNKASYACGGTDSNCMNASYGGYACYCSNDYYTFTEANAYLSEGCMQDYNPKPKEHCQRSCGNMTIPFPFGLEEYCFGNERFQLECTATNETIFRTEYTQYHVTGLSVEDGTLTVNNMLNNASLGEEIIISQTSQGGEGYVDGPVEDDFDFSMEYDIVIWRNSSCEQAMHSVEHYI